ncbi:NYN domain-containing protein [Cylindrospermum stagnale]|nr:NYN domain-containing protein [Cylindrospermum stagnale]
MTSHHLPSNGQKSLKKYSIGIFCDIQNVSSITKFASLLLEFAEHKGTVACKNIYYNSQHKDQVAAKTKLKVVGFNCIDVPDSSKNSADARLTFDCCKLFAPKPSPIPNIIILVLGDWDFAGLISMLNSMGKKVIIFAQRGSESSRLINLVGDDNFHFLDDLPLLVGKKTQPQTTNNELQISYNEAEGYLIETVKNAVSQGKPTNYGYISKSMRQLYPKYQGVASIFTPDGKKFKSFGKFVEAAVGSSGRIQRQNQELRLIK